MKCRASFLISLLLPTVLIAGCAMQEDAAPSVAPNSQPAAATPADGAEGLAGKKAANSKAGEMEDSEAPEPQATAMASAAPEFLPIAPPRKIKPRDKRVKKGLKRLARRGVICWASAASCRRVALRSRGTSLCWTRQLRPHSDCCP